MIKKGWRKAAGIWVLTGLLLTIGFVSHAQTNVQKELMMAARQKFDAMIAGDIPGLKALLHDSLSYIHSNGRVDSKSSLIGDIQSKKEHYKAITEQEISVQMFNQNKLGIYTAVIEIVMVGKESEPPVKLKITEVYNKYAKGWQLLRRHASRM